MAFELVRLSIHDPDSAAISFPAGDAGRKVLVRVSNALVVFLFELVFVSVRIRIATPPEFLDKPLALVVRRQLLESLSLFIGDDVSNVFLQPVFVSFFQLRLDVARFIHRVLALRTILGERREAGSGQEERKDRETKCDSGIRHN